MQPWPDWIGNDTPSFQRVLEQAARRAANDAASLAHWLAHTAGVLHVLATRGAVAWLKCYYMQDRIGEEFDGIVSGVVDFGLFVQLDGLHLNDFGQRCIGRLLTKSILSALTGP